MHDIAECHAISAELFALRAIGDAKAFEDRVRSAQEGPHRDAFAKAVDLAATKGQYKFSPYYVQAAAMMSFSGSIDTIAADTSKERYLEDEFPWCRFRTGTFRTAATVSGSAQNLAEWMQRPLFGQGSNWLRFTDWHLIQDHGAVESFFSSLASFGLDLQVYSMHQGAMLNFRLLATILIESVPLEKPAHFEKLDAGTWMKETITAIPLIEYDNGILFQGFDLDKIYRQDDPIRTLKNFSLMEERVFQLVAHIINGTSARNYFARFYEKQVPDIDILKDKLSGYFKETQLSDSICNMLKDVYERGLKKNLLVTRKRYI